MLERISSGQQGSMGRQRPGRCSKGLFKKDPVLRNMVEVRTGLSRVTVPGKMIGAQRVDHNHHYIGYALRSGPLFCTQLLNAIPALHSTYKKNSGRCQLSQGPPVELDRCCFELTE